MNKAARKVIDYCIANDIGALVVGYNETFQQSSHIGKQNNQNFVNIPYGQLRSKLEYLCRLNGIIFVKQEDPIHQSHHSGIRMTSLFTMLIIQENISLAAKEYTEGSIKPQMGKQSMRMLMAH